MPWAVGLTEPEPSGEMRPEPSGEVRPEPSGEVRLDRRFSGAYIRKSERDPARRSENLLRETAANFFVAEIPSSSLNTSQLLLNAGPIGNDGASARDANVWKAESAALRAGKHSAAGGSKWSQAGVDKRIGLL